jgi:putative oligomerization/nucleic acid binding protein
MNLTQELERLGKLYADGTLSDEEFTKAKSRLLSAPGFSGVPFKSIRRQPSRMVCGLPMWAIAIGPDLESGEMRGHARAIFAVDDMPTGWFAIGGFARGICAFRGLAIGLVAFGGFAIGVWIAVGGAAVGAIAFGGGAIGAIAIGGGACGSYALGGAAVGVHTISGLHRHPEAVRFFQQYFPSLENLIRQGRFR